MTKPLSLRIPIMNRIPVSSSNIASIGYSEAELLLEVEFLESGIYHYYSVPKRVHTELMNASSHGAYLNRFIKPKYRYKQIS